MKGSVSLVGLMMCFFIVVTILMALPFIVYTYQYHYDETNITNITIEEKYPSTNDFMNQMQAYVITTDGDIYNVDDLQYAKLKTNHAYSVKTMPSFFGGSKRTGTIKEIL